MQLHLTITSHYYVSLVLCINISICLLTGFTLPNERKAEEVSDAKDCLHHSLTLISIKNTQPHIIFAMNQCTCVFSWCRTTVYMRISLLRQTAHRWNLSPGLQADKNKRVQSTGIHMHSMEISDPSVKQWNSDRSKSVRF